eukprot:9454074-Pyramimonas_sp.AAC.1
MEAPRFRGHRLLPMANFENPCSSIATLRSQRFWGSSVIQRPAKKSRREFCEHCARKGGCLLENMYSNVCFTEGLCSCGGGEEGVGN